MCCGVGAAHEERVVSVFDLLDCVGVVISLGCRVLAGELMIGGRKQDVRGHGDISTVDDFAPEVEGVDCHWPVRD